MYDSETSRASAIAWSRPAPSLLRPILVFLYLLICNADRLRERRLCHTHKQPPRSDFSANCNIFRVWFSFLQRTAEQSVFPCKMLDRTRELTRQQVHPNEPGFSLSGNGNVDAERCRRTGCFYSAEIIVARQTFGRLSMHLTPD